MPTCQGMINLAAPKGKHLSRGGFSKRIVFEYTCPECHQDANYLATCWEGKRAVPGAGTVKCCRIIPQPKLPGLEVS